MNGHFRRLLRTADDDNEERAGGLSVSALEKVKTVFTASEVSEKTLKGWLKKGKSLDDVFTRMRLTQARDKLLETPQFFTWLKYADDMQATTSGKATSTIATLTAQYGDEALLKMFQAAAKVDKTKQTVVTLEAAQVQSWFSAGKSVDDVFTMLKLNHAGDNILANPVFNTWSAYMQMFNKENPTTKTSLYATLAAHYSDDALFKIAETAKGVKSTAMVAKNLEATHIQKLLSGGKTPDEVFVLLKLDEAGDDLLASPQLNTFTKYMKNFNRENPDKETSLTAAMTTSYGDNTACTECDSWSDLSASATSPMRVHYIVLLAAALIAVTDAVGDDHLGTRFLRTHKSTTSANEEERVNFGGFEIKISLLDNAIERMNQSPLFRTQVDKRASAQDAYKAFKVDKVVGNVFESAQWKEWSKYVKFVAEKKKEVSDENLAAGMSAALTPAGLSNLLANTVKNDKTTDIISKLEAAQLSRWLNGDYTPNAIFNTLALEKTDDIFGTAPFATWTKFLTQYNKKHPDKMVSEVDVLTSTYGEQKFIKMLSSADKSHPDVAQKLRDELVKGWMNDVTHPSNLFTRLKLDEAGDDLLTSPLLTTWVQYMQAFNEKYPKFKTTLIQTFTKSYDDEQIAAMTPKKMLSVLKLNAQTFADNPTADIWRAYNTAYAKKFPSGEFAFQP